MSSDTDKKDKLLDVSKSELLADSEDTYSLYSVGRQVNYKELSDNGIENVNKFIYSMGSYKSANEIYPILKLEKEPAFVVLDTEGIVYKGYDYEELIEFLKNN